MSPNDPRPTANSSLSARGGRRRRGVSRLAAGLRAALACLTILAAAGPAMAQLPGLSTLTGGGGEESAQASGDAAAGEGGAAQGAPTAALLEVLRDPAARDRLIEALEQAQGGADAAAPEAAAAATPAASADPSDEPAGLGERVAALTQETANDLVAAVSTLWTQLAAAPARLGELQAAVDPDVALAALNEIGLTILGTYAVFVALRLLARPLRGRIGREGEAGGPLRRFLLGLGMALLDAATVVLAWAAGYAIAAFLLGASGQVALRQSMYLNAFVAVEIARIAIRLLLRPETGSLRLIPVPDAGARYLASRIFWAAALLGYGQLLVAPIVQQEAGWRAGAAVGTFIGLVVVMIAVVAVLRHRRQVAEWLTPADAESRRVFATLAQLWHVPAMIYLVALFFIVLTRPGNVLWPVLEASGKILAAIVVGMMVNHFLASRARRGVLLPGTVDQRLPLLKVRLNAFVPKLLLAMRILVSLAVLGVALEVTGVFDVERWMGGDVGLRVTGAAVSVGFILLGAFIVWLAFSAWVDWRLSHEVGRVPTPRETTLLTLLRNAATIALLVITLMFALSEIGIDIAPLIASAGVLGLAIGFGAQKLVQDVITGIFIQLENAMNVGDVVTVGGVTGGVEKLTVRSVSIRDLNGTYHLIPFSSVDGVSNFTRDFSFCVMDAGIAYREDLDEAKQAMLDAFEEMKADPETAAQMIGEFEWFGVNALGDSAVVLRGRVKTLPGKQWGLGRLWNEKVKRVFDARGIEIPFPHQTVYFGENKDGSAPPIHLVRDDQRPAPMPVTAPAPSADPSPTGPRTDKSLDRDMPDEDED